jgi:hypothetical protein
MVDPISDTASLADDYPPYDNEYESEEDVIPNHFKSSERLPDYEIKPPTSRDKEVESNKAQLPRTLVDGGVKQHQQLSYMILCAILGASLALGHHLFYLKLDRTVAGSETRQQLAHAFGNILAISVTTSFAFASRAAYKQYFWTVCIFSTSFSLHSPSISGRFRLLLCIAYKLKHIENPLIKKC